MDQGRGRYKEASLAPGGGVSHISTVISTIISVFQAKTYSIATVTLTIIDDSHPASITVPATVPVSNPDNPSSPAWIPTQLTITYVDPTSSQPQDTMPPSAPSGPVPSSQSNTSSLSSSIAHTATTTIPRSTYTSTSSEANTFTSSSPKSAPADSIVSSGKVGVSKGAIAGVAIASFVLGLIAAALIIWALRSRRQHPRQDRFPRTSLTAILAGSAEKSSTNGHKYSPMVPVATKHKEKSLPPVSEPVNESPEEPRGMVAPLVPSQAIAATIPPSSSTIKRKHLSDASASALAATPLFAATGSFSELRIQVKALFEQIELHVDNFYSSEESNIQLTEDQRHDLLQIDSPHLPDSIIGLLPEAKGDEMKTLIKHCLAYGIFSHIGGSCSNIEIDAMLLPSGLISVMQAILPFSNAAMASPETHEQEVDRRCWWKHETVAMMDSNSIEKSDDVQMKIKKLAWLCVRALEPWAVARYGTEARRSHLINTMEQAVEVGLRIFGERKGWLVWQWESNPIDIREGSAEASLVLFPGLKFRKELGSGRPGSRANERVEGSNDVSRSEVVLAPTVVFI